MMKRNHSYAGTYVRKIQGQHELLLCRQRRDVNRCQKNDSQSKEGAVRRGSHESHFLQEYVDMLANVRVPLLSPTKTQN